MIDALAECSVHLEEGHENKLPDSPIKVSFTIMHTGNFHAMILHLSVKLYPTLTFGHFVQRW